MRRYRPFLAQCFLSGDEITCDATAVPGRLVAWAERLWPVGEVFGQPGQPVRDQLEVRYFTPLAGEQSSDLAGSSSS